MATGTKHTVDSPPKVQPTGRSLVAGSVADPGPSPLLPQDAKFYAIDPHSGRQLLVTTRELGEGLFRLSLDRAAGDAMVQVWVSTWATSDDHVRALVERIRPVLERIVTRQ